MTRYFFDHDFFTLVYLQVKNKKALKKKRKMRGSKDLSRGKTSKKITAAEQERINLVTQAVMTKDKPYVCFHCTSLTFESYQELSLHKSQNHGSSGHIFHSKTSFIIKPEPAQEEDDPELHDFVANALTQVPEVTFNNMHGTIHHISSVDGQLFQSKSPALGAVEKVKLNLSEAWSKNDVWESGWEHTHEPLHWHRYNCLSKMSHLSWAQQTLFKDAYDHLKKPTPSSSLQAPPSIKEVKRKVNLFQGLHLKQVGKSVKYMTINEREQKAKLKAKEERRLLASNKEEEEGFLNGEWESPHDFMCSSCAIVYDELREILHHKWEAHPYCLVAHVTLRQDLQLPPSNMMHPQVGRGLNYQPSVKLFGQRKSNPPLMIKRSQNPMKCSKCPPESSPIFEDRNDFYVHLLECGGHEDWDVSKKKKKKKKMLLKRNNSTEQPTNGKKK